MEAQGETIGSRTRRFAVVGTVALAAAILMTWPLAPGIARLDRTANSGDARFSVWNVAWVAHALTTEPGRLFDANIFYPHQGTLAYSESNILTGALAVPAWLLTHDAHVTHNVLVIASFALAAIAMWFLAARLTNDRAAAAVSAAMFAFCPFVFSHTAHIQLLMTAGLPLSLLAVHRLIDRPGAGRGAWLGAALAAQALTCAYYGIFAGLLAAWAAVFYATSRRRWRDARHWIGFATAAGVSILLVGPFFIPYARLQAETGFGRSLQDAIPYSAYWRSYLASAAHAHNWMLPLIGTWNNEVLFPGFLAIALGGAGLAVAVRGSSRVAPGRTSDRETGLFYASIAVLALWVSLGPRAGLYSLLYQVVPVFSLLRAPGRTGLLVTLALAVLAGFGVRALRRRLPRQAGLIGALCTVATLAELTGVPIDWRPIRPVPGAYGMLAGMPRGPVAVFPFYARGSEFHIHTFYMVESTVHWQPLLNGYSDYIPPDFRTLAARLASFPSADSFAAMRERGVRYIVLHRDRYGSAAPAIEARLEPFLTHLRPVTMNGPIVIYEVRSWP
jgi:hypothetical protein